MHEGASEQLLNPQNETVESPFILKAKRCFALLAATTATVVIAVSTDTVENNYDNDNPENPFATTIVIIITKAHKSSSFQI